MQLPMNNLPNDPALLMQHLKGLGNYKGKSQNRRYKQDIQRATLEARLMESEDYTHTEEGVRRMRRYQEEVEMDEEAALSMDMNLRYREDKKAVFRDNLREEAERRLALETEAKEKKRQEALARRQAIIDQMRREKEEEEQRIREQQEKEQREKDEAVAAEQREHERKLYLEKLAVQKFAQNRVQMELEEELSRMFEVEWKEQEALRLRHEEELVEQRAFAEEQRRQNEADELNRKQRVMELHMKKQRLLEMRKSQGKSKAETDAALAAARAEAEAQAKRQRIQNKAMYVSKRMKASESTVTDAGGATATQGGELLDSIIEDSGGGPSKDQVATKQQSMAALTAPPMSPHPAVGHSHNALKEALAEYRASLLTISDVEELRKMSKALMVEKRQMRLQQRNAVPGADADGEAKEMKRRLVECASKEELVQQRIDELSKKKEPPKKKVQPAAVKAVPPPVKPHTVDASGHAAAPAATSTAPVTKSIAATWLANSLLKAGDAQQASPSLMTIPFEKEKDSPSLMTIPFEKEKDSPSLMTIPFEKEKDSRQVPGATATAPVPPRPVKVELSPLELLLKQCETLLRDIISATQVLGPMVERGISDAEFVKQSVVDARHRGTSIELEMVSLGRKYKSLVESPSQDPLEYMDQIRAKWPALRKLMFKMGNYEVEHTAALVIAVEAERKATAEAERVVAAEAQARAEAQKAMEEQARAYSEAQAQVVAKAQVQSLAASASAEAVRADPSATAQVMFSSSSSPLVPVVAAPIAPVHTGAAAHTGAVGAAASSSGGTHVATATHAAPVAPVNVASSTAPVGTSFAPMVVASFAPTAVVFASPGANVSSGGTAPMAGFGYTAGGVTAAASASTKNTAAVDGFGYTAGGVTAAASASTKNTAAVDGFGYTAGGVAAAASASTKNNAAVDGFGYTAGGVAAAASASTKNNAAVDGFGYTAGGMAAAASASTKNNAAVDGFGYTAGGVAAAGADVTGGNSAPVTSAPPSWQNWYTASAIAHAATPFAAPGGGSMFFIEGDFAMGGIEFSMSDFLDEHCLDDPEQQPSLTVGFGYTAAATSCAVATKVPIGPGQVPVQFAAGQVPVAPGEVAVQFAPGQVPIAPGKVAVCLDANQVAIAPGQVAVQLTEGQVPIAPGRAHPKRMPAGKVPVQFLPGQVPIAPGKMAVQLAPGQVPIGPGKAPVQLAPGQVPIAPGLQAIQLSAGQVAVAIGQEIEAVDDNEPDTQGAYFDGEGGDGDEGEPFDPETLPGWKECLHTTMSTAAHHAAFYGFAEVLEFLSNCFDCYVLDEKNRTPLFYACLRGHMDCVVILIGLDANWVDTGDHKGDTPIHAAAISNSTAVLKFLLQCCEVSPDTTNNEGMTPSHIARSKAVLEVLYYASAQQYCVDNCNRNPLYMACSDGRVDCVDFLCRVTPAEFLLWPVAETAPHDANTALHIAAANGHHQCVDLLCQWLEADSLYATNKKGHTPAHVAKNALVLQKLYENGMDLWVADAKYRYPLFIAAFYGRFDAVAFLLEVGAAKLDCINAKDVNGDTALHAAALNGNTQCIELLLFYVRAGPNKQGLSPKLISENRIVSPAAAVASPTRNADDEGGWSHLEVINTIGNARTSPRGPSKTRNTILIDTIESQFRAAYTNKDANSPPKRPDSIGYAIYGCSFGQLVYLLQTYGSRWCKCYDASSDSYYFYDRMSILNANIVSSCWDRPPTFDELEASEDKYESACEILKLFYAKYNPEKVSSVNDILNLYRNRYGELFLQLAERYNVTDLRIFGGIDLSND